MPIVGRGNNTYLLLTGISVTNKVALGPRVELLPAICATPTDVLATITKTKAELAIAMLFLPLTRSQLHVSARNPRELAATAWNAQWDCVLLSALFDRDVVCNLQSDTPANEIGLQTSLVVTNRHLRGMNDSPERQLANEDEKWLQNHIVTARNLLEDTAFQTAVHCLASYRWHPHPRTQLALIWSGIEALFGVDTEIVFRVSLYTSKFLAPDDEHERLSIFKNVKHLYKQRSAAVHGSKMKGNTPAAILESADLLLRLIRRCIESNSLPDPEILAP
jgi:Apea-like HEPN